MPKFLANVDLTLNQLLNAIAQQLASDPGGPSEGQLWYNSTTHLFKVRGSGVTFVLGTLDQILAPAADVSLNSHKITSLATPTADGDAATKAYVDGKVQGLSWKEAVRVAAGADVTVASPGATIDGVTMAQYDRVLLKTQGTGSQNGIYVYDTAATPMTRALDATTAAQLLETAIFVEEGTYADTAWVLTNNSGFTVGSTTLTFVQFGAGTAYSEGDGIDIIGTVISVDFGVVGSMAGANTFGGSNGAGSGTDAAAIDHTHALPSLPAMPAKYAANVGDTSNTTYAITHNLGTKDVIVTVFRVASPYDVVICDVVITDTNNVGLTFAVAPSTNQYRVVVIG
jgi:hypothetical protein